MTRNKTFAWLAMALMVVATAAHAGSPNSIIGTLDGTVNVGTEWFADELTDSINEADLGFDFGPTKAALDMYVTFDATNLYIGITGDNSDSPAFGNDGFIVYLDTTPGAGVNPGPFATFQVGYANAFSTVDLGASANDGGPRIIFPDAFRPDFLLAARYNDAGNKLAGDPSNLFGAGMWSLSNLAAPDNDDAGLDVNVVRNPNIEFSVPWTALYGGAPPANASVGILAFLSSRDWMGSRVLPPLVGTPPIDNPGQDTVTPTSDPGLSGVRIVSITDGAGAFRVGAIQSTLENTFSGIPMDATGVNQVFDASTLQVAFSDVVLDANAETPANYTVTVNAAPATVNAAQIGVNNKNMVYLTLASPLAAGDAVSVTVDTAVTSNGGTSTLPAPDTVTTTAQRRVLWTIDRSASGEENLAANAPFSEPFIRGGWDGYSGRITFSDENDAYPDIPGTQALGTGGDGTYEAVGFINTDFTHGYIINSEIPNAPNSDGGATQFVGVGYWVNGPSDLSLAPSDTTVNLVDEVWNRRLIQPTTVSFIARMPAAEPNGYWGNPAELQAGIVRLQGGTRLGGLSPEGVIEPMVTGGAGSGQAMQFIGQDGAGNSYFFGQVTFPAGVLDVFEFRLVANNIAGLGIDAYEDQDDETGFVHLHTARSTNFDRITPNDQFISWEVVSYDVSPTVANITAADAWDLFE